MQFHIFISAVIAFFFVKIVMGLRIEGHKNITKHGGLIIAPNHVANWDAPVIGISAALRREVFFLAKSELFKPNKFFALFIKKYNAISIKRHIVDRKAMRIISFHLKRGRTIVIFPEGTRYQGKGFLKPLSGVGYFALKNKVKIIPTYIEGTAERMFSLIRRKKKLIIKFGEVIDSSKLNLKGSLLEKSQKITALVMNDIISLGENV